MTTRRPGRAATVGALVLAAVVVLGLLVVRTLTDGGDGTGTAPSSTVGAGSSERGATPTASPAERRGCATGAQEPFVPTTINVPGVVPREEVVGVPRDERGVPGILPVSRKHAFAVDRDGIRPGAGTGHVLLNTHTWPDGPASGNALLRGLDVDGRLVLRGEGRLLCYDVTERVEVRAEEGYPGFDAVDGRPELVIVVCSGERTGPGDWSHRTLWFARPVR